MNESEKRGTVGEAIFGIIFIFIILLFFLYQFGTNQTSVSNSEINQEEENNQTLLNQLGNSDSDDEIYNKYVKQIYDAQIDAEVSGSEISIDKNQKIDEIITNYEKELLDKVKLPAQNIYLANVSEKYTQKIYRDNFELLFAELKKAGGTSESQILASQIVDKDTLLPLSDYDRESILRIATEYEIFVEKLINLSTPTILEKKVLEIAQASMNVNFILKKMVDEKDKKIYTLWISKYVENMSAIITGRYGLQ